MWSPPSTNKARRSSLVTVGCVIVLLYLYTYIFHRRLSFPTTASLSDPPLPSPSDRAREQARLSALKAQVKFWHRLSDAFAAARPDVRQPAQAMDPIYSQSFDAKANIDRPDLLLMGDKDVDKMAKAHQKFMKEIENQDVRPFYEAGLRGIVTTTGPKNLPALVISIRMLRLTGSLLPVQVWLADDSEYNAYVCEKVMPTLAAECRVFADIIDFSSRGSPNLKMYQYKIFAILFSTFDEVLWLDADAFPVRDPASLFDLEPFTSHGLVLWPDFWIGTQSPYYYTISSQEPPSMSLRASSETGEIFVSKTRHWQSLLLASYYNYYGPSHYYRLLSQGSIGEGDKETFLPAATALNEKVYTVSEPIRALGSTNSENEFRGSAMVQFDPTDDFNLTSQGLFRVKDSSAAPAPRPLFIHANCPKLDPGNVFTQDQGFPSPIKDSGGRYQRAWTHSKEIIEAFGWDLERALWKEAVWVACELKDKFPTWKGKYTVCSEMKLFFDTVFKH
ncbi:MAG: hypothetical protein Q9227_002437 [Pyrenula ochraceoflavens]